VMEGATGVEVVAVTLNGGRAAAFHN
jgi:hypothetical protein